MLHTVLHAVFVRSEEVIGPLVPDKSDVGWVAWIKHVEYYKVINQHEISVPDVLKLDSLIFEAQEAFSKVCIAHPSCPAVTLTVTLTVTGPWLLLPTL